MTQPFSAEIQEAAKALLISGFNDSAGHPQNNAGEYTDFWPTDAFMYARSYQSVGGQDLAQRMYDTMMVARRKDGAMPHLQSSRHPRWGLPDTRILDYAAYLLVDKAGLTRSANGRPVTKLYAPPTWASTAEVIMHGRTDGVSFAQAEAKKLIASSYALYGARSSSNGQIFAANKNELSIRDGQLADTMVHDPRPRDILVNATNVLNNAALERILEAAGITFPEDLRQLAESSRTATNYLLATLAPTQPQEATLALARLGHVDGINVRTLESILSDPGTDYKANRRLSMAHLIELAKLTSKLDISGTYLDRIDEKLRSGHPFSRHENILPNNHLITDKMKRAHIWLPTAAVIADTSIGVQTY